MTRFQHLRLAALATFLALASLRCTEKVGPEPVATDIEMLEGDNQTGHVGEPLANPLVVLVTDESGNPVEGVSVTWSAQGGTVAPATTTTGSNGRASVQWTLGSTVGAADCHGDCERTNRLAGDIHCPSPPRGLSPAGSP